MRPPRLPLQSLEGPRIILSSGFVCPSCRHHFLRQSIPQKRPIRCASSKVPFTERLRRRIWATDNAPDQKEAYAGSTFREEMAVDGGQRAQGQHRDESLLATEGAEDGEITSEPVKPAKEYVPAQTWDGLQRIGTDFHWKDIPPTQLDMHRSWTGHLPRKAMNRQELVSCLHSAMVLTILTKEGVSGWDLDEYYFGVDHELSDAISDATIVLADDGSPPRLAFTQPDLRTNLENSRYKDGLPTEQDVVSISTDTLPVPFTNVPDEKFLHAIFDLPEGFFILKIFSRLTGHRVPDPVVNDMLGKPAGWADIITYLEKEIQPKPKNLAETLQRKPELAQLSNLKILDRRETPVDKEKEVGRWKVIEAELRSRGLPVLGKLQA